MTNKVNIFSGINSIGVPYTRDNVKHIGYLEMIAMMLEENGYRVNQINLANIINNRTFDLENILKSNQKYGDIRRQQYLNIKKVSEKNEYMGKNIPKDFLDKYLSKDVLDNVNVTDLFVSSDSPIFLYSGGENDFMTYIGTGPMELVNKEVRDKLPNNLEELLIKSVDCVEKNWQYLISLNPSVRIYVYGAFYAPLYDSIQKEIFRQNKENNSNVKYENIIERLIVIFNKELYERSLSYDNVEYIDIEYIRNYTAEGDFHQNYEGNKLIANQTMEKILEYEKTNNGKK